MSETKGLDKKTYGKRYILPKAQKVINEILASQSISSDQLKIKSPVLDQQQDEQMLRLESGADVEEINATAAKDQNKYGVWERGGKQRAMEIHYFLNNNESKPL